MLVFVPSLVGLRVNRNSMGITSGVGLDTLHAQLSQFDFLVTCL